MTPNKCTEAFTDKLAHGLSDKFFGCCGVWHLVREIDSYSVLEDKIPTVNDWPLQVAVASAPPVGLQDQVYIRCFILPKSDLENLLSQLTAVHQEQIFVGLSDLCLPVNVYLYRNIPTYNHWSSVYSLYCIEHMQVKLTTGQVLLLPARSVCNQHVNKCFSQTTAVTGPSAFPAAANISFWITAVSN